MEISNNSEDPEIAVTAVGALLLTYVNEAFAMSSFDGAPNVLLGLSVMALAVRLLHLIDNKPLWR